MADDRGPGRYAKPKPKTPAERGAEFAADQARLKQEAADRRAAAAKTAGEGGKGR